MSRRTTDDGRRAHVLRFFQTTRASKIARAEDKHDADYMFDMLQPDEDSARHQRMLAGHGLDLQAFRDLHSPKTALRLDFDARVRGPGKFQNEPAYVPYFWDHAEEGEPMDDESELRFEVNADDVHHFPELTGRAFVYLYESNDGFVMEFDK